MSVSYHHSVSSHISCIPPCDLSHCLTKRHPQREFKENAGETEREREGERGRGREKGRERESGTIFFAGRAGGVLVSKVSKLAHKIYHQLGC